MFRKTVATTVIGTLIGLGMLGSASADPEESQRLRGLGGRVFLVLVQDLFAEPGSPEEFFENCYVFNSDGSWEEPLFPVPGTWEQDSVGAKTSYAVSALAEDFDVGIIVDVLLEQTGKVTPARGKGNLQLTAFSQVFFADFTPEGEDLLVAEFLSNGYEVDECPL